MGSLVNSEENSFVPFLTVRAQISTREQLHSCRRSQRLGEKGPGTGCGLKAAGSRAWAGCCSRKTVCFPGNQDMCPPGAAKWQPSLEWWAGFLLWHVFFWLEGSFGPQVKEPRGRLEFREWAPQRSGVGRSGALGRGALCEPLRALLSRVQSAPVLRPEGKGPRMTAPFTPQLPDPLLNNLVVLLCFFS